MHAVALVVIALWAVAALWSAPAVAAEQATRAVAAVRQLVASGAIKPGAVMRIRVKQGNLVSFLGRDHELQKAWEQQTGILIDASVMPQLDSLEFVRGSTDVDLTIARTHELPDLFDAGLIEDLTPMLARWGFALGDEPSVGYMLPRHQAYFGERVVAIPADMDIALLFLRRDLLEDAAQGARFRQLHGRVLRPPRTWAEYQQLVEFFHRPAEGFYGSAEPREKLTGWMYWMPRYLGAAAPNQHLFDEQMRPLVNSPAGVAATEAYIATVPHSPPQSLDEGKDYSYTLPFFISGKAFATILTVATAKISNREGSAVKGKFMAAAMPGHVVGNRLVRRTQFIYGNNLVVPKTAPNKALGFLFAMWLTDPDNSTRSVSANGFTDPYRYVNLRAAQVQALYSTQALDMLTGELAITAPSGTGLPGDSEYLAALSNQIWLAAAKRITPREAMERTAREWEAITERRGRERQAEHWRAFRKLYPTMTEAVR